MSHNHPLDWQLIVVSLNISLYPYTSVLYRLFLHSLPYGIYRRGLFNISSLCLCRFCVCVLIYAKVLIIPNVVAPLIMCSFVGWIHRQYWWCELEQYNLCFNSGNSKIRGVSTLPIKFSECSGMNLILVYAQPCVKHLTSLQCL